MPYMSDLLQNLKTPLPTPASASRMTQVASEIEHIALALAELKDENTRLRAIIASTNTGIDRMLSRMKSPSTGHKRSRRRSR